MAIGDQVHLKSSSMQSVGELQSEGLHEHFLCKFHWGPAWNGEESLCAPLFTPPSELKPQLHNRGP